MLKEDTLFGPTDKPKIAMQRLNEYYPGDKEKYYCAFSGGKDSIVIYDLLKKSRLRFEAFYNVTTVDPPELVTFIRRKYPEVNISRPDKNMFRLIREKGLPTRTRRWCCEILKERGGQGRIVVTGIRAEESGRRAKRKVFEECYRKKSATFYLNLIFDWREEDVWEYIRQNEISYCKLYDEGFKRIGCILCPMVRNIEEQKKRWPKIFNLYKKAAFDYYNERKKTKPESVIYWNSFDDFFNWWLDRDAKKRDMNQQTLFE